MSEFSTAELVNMVFCIGKSDGNCLLAAHIYKANYPNLPRYPQTKCLRKLKERFQRTGNVKYEKNTRKHACTEENKQIDIIQTVIIDPTIGVRQISHETGVSKSTVNKVLQKNKFHPYHLQHQQYLSDMDFENRMTFCHWAENQLEENPNFFTSVLFSDESTFTNTGRANPRIVHHYADRNPRLFRIEDYQHRFKVNVWAGICGDYLIGPHFFEANLNGATYLQFLQTELQLLQSHVPHHVLRTQWFQQDGAPAHSTLMVFSVL